MNRRVAFVGALVVFVAVVVGAALILRNGGDGDETSSSTTAPATSTTSETTSTTAAVPDGSEATVLWPQPGDANTFATPAAAASSFAKTFLRFEAPVVGDFAQGDSRSGEVPVRPSAKGPVTTVLVRQVGPGDAWSVLAAVNDSTDVSEPSAGAVVSSPVRVAGEAVAFEGTVQVEVRQDGRTAPIGEGFVTGGGDVKRPFDGRISFEPATARYGALVFFTLSAENGQVWQAAAFRIAFAQATPAGDTCGSYHAPHPQLAVGQMEVKAYFTCGARGETALYTVYRAVPASPARLKASLAALLVGPTAEEKAATLTSWFSPATADMLRSVVIDNGHAVVDFGDLRPVIPNASASAGSQQLLGQLDATVFQFSSVSTAEYRIDGSCEAFTEWLQIGGCDPRTRPSGGGSP